MVSQDVGREGDWVIKSRATTGVNDHGAAPCHRTSDEFRHPLNSEPGLSPPVNRLCGFDKRRIRVAQSDIWELQAIHMSGIW